MKKFIKRALPVFLCIWILAQNVNAAQLLVPGGQVIGLALSDNTVTVAAFDEQLGKNAKASGLRIGDQIARVDNQRICTAEDVQQALRCSDGSVDIMVLREGKAKKMHVEPMITESGPRLGVYLKQGVTGIGTVTWYEPQTGTFGALGHGVSTPNGDLVAMQTGAAFAASVVSVRKGKTGEPGQLMGTLTDQQSIGQLIKNTPQGVFGKMECFPQEQSLPVGSMEQVHTGDAVIRSTINDSKVQEYSVEILKIYPGSATTGRNMLLKVVDAQLLETTGGIVQGMSGSPIIQDGKLIGAVTHVLVNDPTTGYGIFIENMLNAVA